MTVAVAFALPLETVAISLNLEWQQRLLLASSKQVVSQIKADPICPLRAWGRLNFAAMSTQDGEGLTLKMNQFASECEVNAPRAHRKLVSSQVARKTVVM